MLEADFLALASTTVTLEPCSTFDAYGAPSYGVGVTYSAVVQRETRRIRATDGWVEVDGTAIYVLSSSATAGLSDRVTLPNGNQPQLLHVWTENDEQGQHHLELFVG